MVKRFYTALLFQSMLDCAGNVFSSLCRTNVPSNALGGKNISIYTLTVLYWAWIIATLLESPPIQFVLPDAYDHLSILHPVAQRAAESRNNLHTQAFLTFPFFPNNSKATPLEGKQENQGLNRYNTLCMYLKALPNWHNSTLRLLFFFSPLPGAIYSMIMFVIPPLFIIDLCIHYTQ